MSEEKKDYRGLALMKLGIHRGEQETPPGSNKGPVVDWAVTPWAGKSHGAMPWCAGAVSTAYLEAGYPAMNKIGSLSCDTLYRNVCSLPGVKILKAPLFLQLMQECCEKYVKEKKEKQIHVLGCPCGCIEDGVTFDLKYFKQNAGFWPASGDMIFFGEEHNLHHVGLVIALQAYPGSQERLKMGFFVKTIEGNHKDGVHWAVREDFFAIVRLP